MTAKMTAKLSPANLSASEIVSLNPATLEELARFPVATAGDVEAAISRARAAQPAWAGLSIRNRARYILKARRALYDRQDELIELLSRETGKPRFEALTTEVLPTCDLMSHFAMKTEKILRDERFSIAVFRNKRSMITYEPLGVVGVITPWNFPFAISMGEVVMAMMAGNTVVLKPSEYTPMIGEFIRRLFAAAGFPDGVFAVVQGDGTTGAALVDADVDKIFFTGSVRTGKADRRGGGQKAHAGRAGAGRQRRDDRLSRRAVRTDGERRRVGGVRQLRADLRLGRAPLRRRDDRRPLHPGGRRGGEEAAARRPRRQLFSRRRAARQRGAVIKVVSNQSPTPWQKARRC